MENKFLLVNFTLRALGIIAAISCVCWCVYEYSLDNDLSLVEHKIFGEDEASIMPSFSLCFSDPFLEDRLENNDLNVNISEYKTFLAGKHWNDAMSLIKFENVTKRLEDYAVGLMVINNEMVQKYYDGISSIPDDIKKPYLSYTGFQFGFIHKCYSVDMPLNSLSVALKIKKGIFPNGIRPSTMGFHISVHYPNQFLSSFPGMRNSWPNQEKNSINSYAMFLNINIFEITIRRNTKTNPCNQKWRKDDFEIYQKWADKIKCKAPYQTWNTSYPFCNTKEKMAQANLDFNARKKSLPPCHTVEKVVYEYTEFEPKIPKSAESYFANSSFFRNTNDTFQIIIGLQSNKFKAIVHKKAYDLQTLIGNCGGYIGLILGKLISMFSND